MRRDLLFESLNNQLKIIYTSILFINSLVYLCKSIFIFFLSEYDFLIKIRFIFFEVILQLAYGLLHSLQHPLKSIDLTLFSFNSHLHLALKISP